VRLAALRPLHPARAMLADLDQRLAALAAQRERLYADPDAPLPPESVPYDPPPLPALAGPEAVAARTAAPLPVAPRLDALRRRLEQERDRQERRLRRQLEDEYAAAVEQQRAALSQRRAQRRLELAQAYRLDLVNADLRRKGLPEGIVRNEAESAYRALQQRIAADEARIDREIDAEMARTVGAEEARRAERLQRWRAEQEDRITRAVAEQAAALHDAAPPPAAPAAAPLDFPALAARPVTVETGALRIAINRAHTEATVARLDAVSAIDETVHRLTLQRIALERQLDNDIRAAARTLAQAHGWQIAFDTPRGQEITGEVTAWLADYWPPAVPPAQAGAGPAAAR